uniref:Uncharacterized protein n=1 Tax=Phenylobacterium glaciei TaxID=2803784 RepID=A0A974P6Z9_9CAUL|nr:hypothetical protein JKL49_11205 [Phenylobacterium glaciei]
MARSVIAPRRRLHEEARRTNALLDTAAAPTLRARAWATGRSRAGTGRLICEPENLATRPGCPPRIPDTAP